MHFNCISSEEKELLVKLLVESGCVKFGSFTLKSGQTTPYYVDLREATMHPQLFGTIVELLTKMMPNGRRLDDWRKAAEAKPPCAVVGVPYGVVPLAGALAHACKLHYYPVRKEVKDYGHKPDSSSFSEFEFVLVEDVMSTGSSIVETIHKMEGKKITDVIVMVDRQLGGREKLAHEYPSIKVHSLLNITEVLEAVERQKATSTAS